MINNAGLLARDLSSSVDGLEMNFAVNVAAPWWLTHAVLPALRRSTHPRVVNVTGGAPFGGLDVDNLQAEKGFLGLSTYSMAKRAMEAMSQELRRRLEPDGIDVVVVYPGGASTSMTQGMSAGLLPWWMRPMWPVFAMFSRDDGGKSAKKASRSSVWAATTRELGVSSDEFVRPDKTKKRLHKTVLDQDAQRTVIETIESARSNAGS
ncbi:MAG: SDR family NAD(P)-dependent oxidoreductase [Myxococcota bacterium]